MNGETTQGTVKSRKEQWNQANKRKRIVTKCKPPPPKQNEGRREMWLVSNVFLPFFRLFSKMSEKERGKTTVYYKNSNYRSIMWYTYFILTKRTFWNADFAW